jgi:Protein of unknown function (DUF1579)
MRDSQSSSPSQHPPKPHPELRRLEPLVGTWRTKDHTRDSVLGPGVAVESIETFGWLDGGYFLVSTYETAFGDEPLQTGVMYWGYDSNTNRFHNRFFSNNGPYDTAGNEYIGEVTGDELTFVGPARFQYHLGSDGRIRPNADGSISVAWWLPDDHGNWQPWMRNTFVRLKSSDTGQ